MKQIVLTEIVTKRILFAQGAKFFNNTNICNTFLRFLRFLGPLNTRNIRRKSSSPAMDASDGLLVLNLDLLDIIMRKHIDQ
jgi:hypothetical protein